jgi:hypothetical protein
MSNTIRTALSVQTTRYSKIRSAFEVRHRNGWRVLGYGGTEKEALDAAVDRLEMAGWDGSSMSEGLRLLREWEKR